MVKVTKVQLASMTLKTTNLIINHILEGSYELTFLINLVQINYLLVRY
jgi:hypothetical protein